MCDRYSWKDIFFSYYKRHGCFRQCFQWYWQSQSEIFFFLVKNENGDVFDLIENRSFTSALSDDIINWNVNLNFDSNGTNFFYHNTINISITKAQVVIRHTRGNDIPDYYWNLDHQRYNPNIKLYGYPI